MTLLSTLGSYWNEYGKSVGISISDYLLSIDFLFVYLIVYYARSQ